MKSHCSKFYDELEGIGFFQHYSSLGAGNIRPWDWEQISNCLYDSIKPVWDLLLCRKSVGKNELLKALSGRTINWLKKIGALHEQNDNLSTNGKYLLPQAQGFVLLDGTEMRLLGGEAAAYAAAPGGRGTGLHLSVYSNGGVENVVAQRQGYDTYVLKHPWLKAETISATLSLNDIDAASCVIENYGKGAYDSISSTPPCLPHPESLPLPACYSGGRDGLDKVGKSFEIAAAALTKKGSGLVSFVLFGNDDLSTQCEKIGGALAKNRLKGEGLITSRLRAERGSPFFSGYAGLLSGKNGDLAEGQRILNDHFKAAKISHGYFCSLRISRGVGFKLTNVSTQYYGTYFI